ncbi:hypothetical protein Q8A73_006159 [Channa argus]|nr:hypothetical protein Q8A73_006159 [Channa argus]
MVQNLYKRLRLCWMQTGTSYACFKHLTLVSCPPFTVLQQITSGESEDDAQLHQQQTPSPWFVLPPHVAQTSIGFICGCDTQSRYISVSSGNVCARSLAGERNEQEKVEVETQFTAPVRTQKERNDALRLDDTQVMMQLMGHSQLAVLPNPPLLQHELHPGLTAVKMPPLITILPHLKGVNNTKCSIATAVKPESALQRRRGR